MGPARRVGGVAHVRRRNTVISASREKNRADPQLKWALWPVLKKSPNFLKGALVRARVLSWNELAKLTAGGGAMLRRRR